MANQTIKTCCFIYRPASPGVDAIYCGLPTRYKIVKDDDGNRIRDYDTRCPQHTNSSQLPYSEDDETDV